MYTYNCKCELYELSIFRNLDYNFYLLALSLLRITDILFQLMKNLLKQLKKLFWKD